MQAACHLSCWNTDTASDSLGVIASPHDQPALDLYTRRFASNDPRMQVASQLGAGRWMVCANHFSTRDVARSAIWQELLVPWGLRYSLCTTLSANGPVAVAAAFMRDTHPFGSGPLAMAQALLPPLQRAAALVLKSTAAADQQAPGGAALAFGAPGPARADRAGPGPAGQRPRGGRW